MKVIELKDLSFKYRGNQTVRATVKKVNFFARSGEMVAIQGKSGSGKSTLLYLIGGMLKPDSGKVLLLGDDLAKVSPTKMAHLRNQVMGFVFQQFHLLPKTTAYENILLPAFYPAESAKVHKADHDRVTELAQYLGIADRLGHMPNELSGGQQQRVAIARALMRDPKIILADEPTGNLDSKNSKQTIGLLREQANKGRTVVIVTHDPEISKQCDRVYEMVDGVLSEGAVPEEHDLGSREETRLNLQQSSHRSLMLSLLPLALSNINRNRIRSVLTMMGITIGVAAVLAMVTLGEFTKDKILEGYAMLGVNTAVFHGRPNWDLKATDKVPVMYRFFDVDEDLAPLPKIFPEIEMYSPIMSQWHVTANYGGRSIENEVRTFGVTPEAFKMGNTPMLMGSVFSRSHVDLKSGVCVIGYEIASRLFASVNPLGKVLRITDRDKNFGCRIVGVMAHQTSNHEWLKPDLHVYMPHTYFGINSDFWSSRIRSVMMQIRKGVDIDKVGYSVQAFFEQKYGASGHFRVSGDSRLVAQMHRFLNMFTLLLAAIALVSLGVGGIGITNMMLVSVSERLKEIGLRKAVGATDKSIRVQFLLEAICVCVIAGLVGLFIGFAAYETVIYVAARFVPSVEFKWVFNFGAILLSVISILTVGLLSGLVPALKAEKLQVIEALRTE